MILKLIAQTLDRLNEKVDAIAYAIGPNQEAIKKQIRQTAFDCDLVSRLSEATTRNLATMEAEAYAKYVHGMTQLGKKKGVKAAEDFAKALERLNQLAPDDYMPKIIRTHHEIEEWQKKAEQSMRDMKKSIGDMASDFERFQSEAENYKLNCKKATGELISKTKELEKTAETATTSMLASAKQTIGKAESIVRDECKEVISKGEMDIGAEVERVKKALDIPGKIKELRKELKSTLSQTHLRVCEEANAVLQDYSLKEKAKQMQAEIEEFKEFNRTYESRFKDAAMSASLAMQKTHKQINDELRSVINENRETMEDIKHSVTADCVKAMAKAKEDMGSELARAVKELETTVADMEQNKHVLQTLAKKASANIIETERTIARNSNALPRSQRGRRNN